jgi:hypothetical protein
VIRVENGQGGRSTGATQEAGKEAGQAGSGKRQRIGKRIRGRE